MKHINFPVAGIIPTSVARVSRPSKRTGFFARLVAAMHESRRRQALLYLTTHRHLFADDAEQSSRSSGGDNHADR
jgi:hypothetical protein